MLGNLIVNAIKYGAVGRPVRVAVNGREADVRLEVRNQGSAIDRTTLAEMFQPLKRGTSTAARADDGLGLGLYIAGEIAKAHGGAIDAHCDDTETVFAVSLPRRRHAGG